MKKSYKTFLLSVALVLIGVVCFHEFSRENKYKLGMSIFEVQLLTGGRYPVEATAYSYDSDPTQTQMEEDTPYYVYDKDVGVLLMFNHHQKLVRKQRIKWFGVDLGKAIDSFR